MDKIFDWINKSFKKYPVIIGVQGIQGCGKSTLCEQIENTSPDSIFAVSLDDFYKINSEINFDNDDWRLCGRGNPGTHDVELLYKCLYDFKHGLAVEFPIYDKTLFGGHGDRSRATKTSKITSTILLVEGWCLGFTPINDGDIIDENLKEYQNAFSLIDGMIVLQSDIENLREWRFESEKKMSYDETQKFIDRFIPTYDRYLERFISLTKSLPTSLILNVDGQRVLS
tara:strand:- start:957 stop:1637 length:681 start_codon:yes stop_codon:yes gene_type:complete